MRGIRICNEVGLGTEDLAPLASYLATWALSLSTCPPWGSWWHLRWHLEQKEKARYMVLMARESEAESKASVLQRLGEACCEEGWLLKTGVGHQGLEQGQ